MLCFYHSADLDGHCSGALIRRAYPDCEMIGINYGDEFPWEKIKGEDVWMVDFALQPFDQMAQIRMLAKSFSWIDHHKSAIEESSKFPEIWGLRQEGKAACELVWACLHSQPAPLFVYLLGRHDVWDHSDARTLLFQFGMRQFSDTRPEGEDFDWEELFNEETVNRIISKGEIILDYINAENTKYAAVAAFETELDGLRCVAINKLLTNSQIFDSVWDPDKYDAMLTFGWRAGGFWTVSLYTDKPGVDVSVVAKSRGGGGHVQAAGFQCDFLPFLSRPVS